MTGSARGARSRSPRLAASALVLAPHRPRPPTRHHRPRRAGRRRRSRSWSRSPAGAGERPTSTRVDGHRRRRRDVDGHRRAPSTPSERRAARPCWRSTPATACAGDKFEAAKTPPRRSSTPSPTTSTSASSPSPATSTVAQRAHHRTATPSRAVIDGLELTPQTRLYDGVLAGRRRQPATDGSAHRCSCSPTAPTPARPRSTTSTAAVERRRGRASTSSPSPRARPTPAALEQHRRGRRRPGHRRRRPGGPAEALRRPRPTPWPARSWSPSTLPADVAGDEATTSRSRCRRRRATVTRPRRSSPIRGRAPSADGPAAAPPPWSPGSWSRRVHVRRPRRRSALGLLAVVRPAGARGRKAQPDAVDRRHRGLHRASGAQAPAAGGPRPRPTSLTQQAKDAADERAASATRASRPGSAPRLEAAGCALKPAEWLLLHAAIAVVAGLIGAAARRRQPAARAGRPVLGAAVGPWLYLGFKQQRRRKAFNEPAGRHPAADVRRALRRPVAGPVGRHGRPRGHRADRRRVPAGARRDPARRRASRTPWRASPSGWSSKDFDWVVMAIRIQRRSAATWPSCSTRWPRPCASGSTCGARSPRCRAEGRLSAWILGGLPPVFMLYLLLTNRDYVGRHVHRAARLGDARRRMAVLLAVGHLLDEQAREGGGLR